MTNTQAWHQFIIRPPLLAPPALTNNGSAPLCTSSPPAGALAHRPAVICRNMLQHVGPKRLPMKTLLGPTSSLPGLTRMWRAPHSASSAQAAKIPELQQPVGGANMHSDSNHESQIARFKRRIHPRPTKQPTTLRLRTNATRLRTCCRTPVKIHRRPLQSLQAAVTWIWFISTGLQVS